MNTPWSPALPSASGVRDGLAHALEMEKEVHLPHGTDLVDRLLLASLVGPGPCEREIPMVRRAKLG